MIRIISERMHGEFADYALLVGRVYTGVPSYTMEAEDTICQTILHNASLSLTNREGLCVYFSLYKEVRESRAITEELPQIPCISNKYWINYEEEDSNEILEFMFLHTP